MKRNQIVNLIESTNTEYHDQAKLRITYIYNSHHSIKPKIITTRYKIHELPYTIPFKSILVYFKIDF